MDTISRTQPYSCSQPDSGNATRHVEPGITPVRHWQYHIQLVGTKVQGRSAVRPARRRPPKATCCSTTPMIPKLTVHSVFGVAMHALVCSCRVSMPDSCQVYHVSDQLALSETSCPCDWLRTGRVLSSSHRLSGRIGGQPLCAGSLTSSWLTQCGTGVSRVCEAFLLPVCWHLTVARAQLLWAAKSQWY